ncbi:uncharacterized protein LOC141851117 [Brevipalpus obovatus]|uniref:uncharacterized protein LOC141851117 n=1 Tax=Brevipalpus obovatus TaxID=246614 RepID=UPI003D9F4B77
MEIGFFIINLWFLAFLSTISYGLSSPIVFRDETYNNTANNRNWSSRRIDPKSETQFNGDHHRISSTTEVLRWPNGKIATQSTTPSSRRQNSDIPTYSSRNANTNANKPLIFPQSDLVKRPRYFIPTLNSNGLPDCVKSPSDTFCEQVENYPRVDLKAEFGLDIEKFRDLFGVKGIDARKSYLDDDTSSYGEKICEGKRRISYPKMGRNRSKRWVYIVNDENSDFRQHVVTEICSPNGRPCSHLEGNLPLGYVSHCRQNYASIPMQSFHPTENRIYTDIFQFPTCCSCYIKLPFHDNYSGGSQTSEAPSGNKSTE